MIPKIIHYCWFGGNPLPDLSKKCIVSWKQYCPDYEIKEWNESNFDLNCCDYVREAAQAKKWAFVSDYARFWILYNYGGIYFDTDVELIKPIDEIVKKGPFMGFEIDPHEGDKTLAPGLGLAANPGLGLAANPGLGLYKNILEVYEKRHFLNQDGTTDQSTVVTFITEFLVRDGLDNKSGIQYVDGIYIYPSEYFCPMDYDTGKINTTENTVSIHHFSASWLSKTEDKILEINRFCLNKFGEEKGRKIARIIDFSFRVKNKIEKFGIGGTIRFVGEKLRL